MAPSFKIFGQNVGKASKPET